MDLLNTNNRIDRFAKAVSAIFHPLIIVIPTMVIVTTQQGSTIWQSLFWTFLAVCIVNLPMAFLIFYGVRSGRYSDPSISIRAQRHSLYAVGGFCMVVLVALLIFGKAPIILTACLIAATLATAISFMINRRFTKLSLHSVGMAGCATVLILTIPMLGIAMALFGPLLAWARIHLKHHTPLQILIGWMVSVFSVLIVFYLLHLFL
jgi:hypothetical protein